MKLLILDNCSAVYARLIELLGGIESLTALSIARNLADLPDKLDRFQPNAIVLDVNLPDGRSLTHIKCIRERVPSARIYIFSNHYEYKNHAVNLGADGFFDKSLEFEQLIARLRTDAEKTRQIPQKEPVNAAHHS